MMSKRCLLVLTALASLVSSTSNITFDYVVVGGGTGGLAVAKRLSEHPNITVAVIEAGGLYESTLDLNIPAGDNYAVGASLSDSDPEIDWNIVTTPQPGAAGRSVHYARGKCLGGSSARNYMVYQRGTIGSYQRWADAVGDQSYAWDNFLPYLKRSPNFTPPNSSLRASNATAEYRTSAFDATDSAGPVDVSYPNYAQPFSSWVQGSLIEIGIPTTEDFNSGSLLGNQYCSSTVQPANENRESSQTAFFPGLASGNVSNVVIYSNTLAKRILFNRKKHAIGVMVSGGNNSTGSGGTTTIRARKEVILSAGAFQSPQLLMVSGVGPKATLDAFGINVVSDLPGVGQNMWDHVFFGPTYRVNIVTSTRLANDQSYLVSAFGNFTATQTGPLTNTGCDFLGWEKAPADVRSCFSPSTLNDLATLPDDWPEFEYIAGAGYVGNFSSLLYQPNDGYQYATILGTIVSPFSRGNVTIRSADTSDLPVVSPNWLTHKTDQELAVAAFKRARAAFQTKFMSGVLVDPPSEEYYPGLQVESDEDILDLIRSIVMTVWHAACTCKMGKKHDPMAVIDSRARVYGVHGLRVVDASAFPLLPPGHPQSTIYALAEKIVDDILLKHRGG